MVLQVIKNRHLFQNETQPATVIATQKWENILANHDDQNNLKLKVLDTFKVSINKEKKEESNLLIENKPLPTTQSKLISQNTVRETKNKTQLVQNQPNKIYPIISSAMSNIEALIQVSASDGIRRSSGPLLEKTSNAKLNMPFNFTRKQDGLAYIKQDSYPKFPFVPNTPFQSFENKNNSSETSSKSELLKKSSFDYEFFEDKN
jgi:hypothetical protein